MVFEQPGSTRMFEPGTGPEDPHILFDLRIIHAAVIHDRARTRSRQLTKHVFGETIRKAFLKAEPVREIDNNLPIHPRLPRWRYGLLQAYASALTRGDCPFVLFLKGAC